VRDRWTFVRAPLFLAAALTSACATATADSSPPARRVIALFHIADVHSHVLSRKLAIGERDAELGLGEDGGTAVVGGAARLASLLDRERARSEVSFFFDSGDVLEGASIFSAFHGVPETLSQEALGLDAQAVGNHDLTHGSGALAELRAGRATFPLLAANLDDLVASAVALPSAVFERAGVRVGVVGLGRVPDDAIDLDRCAAAVERTIAGLATPVDAVVLLSHLGRDSDLSLIPKTAGIDIVLGGHTHDILEPPKSVSDCGEGVRSRLHCDPRPVTVVHSGAYGRYVGRLDLTLSSDPADQTGLPPSKRARLVATRYSLLPVNEAVPERPDLVELLEPYREALAKAGLERPVAFAPSAISRRKPAGGDSSLGNFVARAMRVGAGADLAVINTTGVRADLPQGELTVDDFFEVLPFEDFVLTLDIRGDDLARAFVDVARASCDRSKISQAEIDGGTAVLDCTGSASADVSLGGEPLEAGRTYRVAVASFLTEAGQWFRDRGRLVDRGRPIRDIVVGAAQSGRPCPSSAPSELPCVDAASGALADGRISWR
jgi:5'-nucleotidase